MTRLSSSFGGAGGFRGNANNNSIRPPQRLVVTVSARTEYGRRFQDFLALWDAGGVTRPDRHSRGTGGFKGKANSNSVRPPLRPVVTVSA